MPQNLSRGDVPTLILAVLKHDYPDTWFAKLVMAFTLSSGILGMGVAEIVQTYLRSRNQQNRA